MKISFAAILFGLVAAASALPQDSSAVLEARQNGNRPTPSGACCVANTNLKQDSCKATNGAAGKCVPGGNNCGGALSCVAQANLVCDAKIQERGKPLCRAKAANGGLFDGARIIQNLNQAKVN